MCRAPSCLGLRIPGGDAGGFAAPRATAITPGSQACSESPLPVRPMEPAHGKGGRPMDEDGVLAPSF